MQNFVKVTLISIILICFSSISYAGNTSSIAKSDEQNSVKLLAFSGSARKDSYNTKALKLLVRAAQAAGAKVTVINLSDYSMPIYDGDLESQQSLPENAKKLQALIAEHDGLLIASPEYNGLPTPLLKNVLDWASRPNANNPNSGLKIFAGKAAALISTSPSIMGGIRGLPITAQLLTNLGMVVLPEKVAIGNCMEKFNAQGELLDKQLVTLIEQEGSSVYRLVKALKTIN